MIFYTQKLQKAKRNVYLYIMNPQLTVSGYRGIWKETLTIEIVENFIRGFSMFLKKQHAATIIVGRDARQSGAEISQTVCETLAKEGFNVIDAGIIPTPTILLVIRKWGLSGGIIITASHNPKEYNGLKFVTKEGLFTNEQEVEEIKSYLNQQTIEDSELPPNSIVKRDDAGDVHIDTILSHIDSDTIRERKFHVFLDPINSAGAVITPKFLEELGCSTKIINGEPNGIFAHKPEPIPENLVGLGKQVVSAKADVGFVQDPDADRLVIIDEHGTILHEEYTLALAVKAIMLKKPGTVVTNCATSFMSEIIAHQYGAQRFITKVGEANVIGGIQKHNAVIGGEGSGGVIYPTINMARDSIVGIALVLELMAKTNKPLSQIVSELPPITMTKEKITFSGDLQTVYKKIEGLFSDGIFSYLDGLRIDFPSGAWLLIRPSNTEPIVRIFAEGKNIEITHDMIERVKTVVI